MPSQFYILPEYFHFHVCTSRCPKCLERSWRSSFWQLKLILRSLEIPLWRVYKDHVSASAAWARPQALQGWPSPQFWREPRPPGAGGVKPPASPGKVRRATSPAPPLAGTGWAPRGSRRRKCFRSWEGARSMWPRNQNLTPSGSGYQGLRREELMCGSCVMASQRPRGVIRQRSRGSARLCRDLAAAILVVCLPAKADAARLPPMVRP